MRRLIFSTIMGLFFPALVSAGDYYRSERNVLGGQNFYAPRQVYRSQKATYGTNYYSSRGAMYARPNVMGGQNYYGRSPFGTHPEYRQTTPNYNYAPPGRLGKTYRPLTKGKK